MRCPWSFRQAARRSIEVTPTWLFVKPNRAGFPLEIMFRIGLFRVIFRTRLFCKTNFAPAFLFFALASGLYLKMALLVFLNCRY